MSEQQKNDNEPDKDPKMILDLTEVLKKHHHAFSAIMNRVEKAKAEREQNKEKETIMKGSKRKLRKKRESNHTNN